MKIIFEAKTFDSKKKIDETAKDRYIQIIDALYNQINQRLDLSLLEKIIVPEEYVEGLYRFQKENGHEEFVTKNDYAQGLAQVVSSVEDGKTVYNIVIDKNMIIRMVPDNIMEELKESLTEEEYKFLVHKRQLSINMFFHECSHVHEFAMRKGLRWLEEWKVDRDNLESQYIQLAINVWQEYFACRTASISFLFEFDDLLEIFNTCKSVESMLQERRKQYNIRKIDLNEFCQIFNSHIEFLMKKLGSAHGNFYFFEENRQEMIDKVERGLIHTKASSVWRKQGIALDNLYETFPCWKDASVFNELIDVLKEYMESYEIYISQTSEGIYYDIPLRL